MNKVKEKLNIPFGWKVFPLHDLCDSLDNRRIPITKSDRVSGNVPYYGATGIIDYVRGYTFDEEILLIGEDGADWSPYANKAFIVRGKSWVNNHAHVLKCKNISGHEYLEQYLNWKNLDIYTTGGTRKKLNKEVLMSLPVCLPESKIEQQKIVEILETVDEDIAKTQAVIEATEKLKRGLMQQLFTRGIGHTKFKETKIGRIPEKWDVRKLETVCSKIVDGVHKKPNYASDGGIPFVTVKNLTAGAGISFRNINFITEKDHKEYIKRANPEKGDVLVTKDGTLGIARVVETDEPFSIFVSVALLKPLHQFIDSYFLRYGIECTAVSKQFSVSNSGSALKHIHLIDFRSTLFPIPSTLEQKKITNILSKVDEKISVNQKLQTKLTLLKQGLMQDLLSGKVRTI